MPGVTKDDITINLDSGKLTLAGIRRIGANGTGNWEEFGEAEYGRTFSVPQIIDVNKVRAELKDGGSRDSIFQSLRPPNPDR